MQHCLQVLYTGKPTILQLTSFHSNKRSRIQIEGYQTLLLGSSSWFACFSYCAFLTRITVKPANTTTREHISYIFSVFPNYHLHQLSKPVSWVILVCRGSCNFLVKYHISCIFSPFPILQPFYPIGTRANHLSASEYMSLSRRDPSLESLPVICSLN